MTKKVLWTHIIIEVNVTENYDLAFRSYCPVPFTTTKQKILQEGNKWLGVGVVDGQVLHQTLMQVSGVCNYNLNI